MRSLQRKAVFLIPIPQADAQTKYLASAFIEFLFQND
jgi:hypothetical protein